jgi:hypothetical protein
MFNKRIMVSTLAVFATMMVFGIIVFGTLLRDFYAANMGDLAVRPEGEELMGWLVGAQLIMSYAFVWIWGHGVKGGGMNEGLRFGFFMGLFWATVEMMNYAFMPMHMNVMIVGFILDIVMFILAGVVLSTIWGKMAETE